MTKRTKITFALILIIVILAIAWFIYSKNKQQNVRSQNGNVSALFPFTGTNATDYGTEQNSGAPTNGYVPATNNTETGLGGNNSNNNNNGNNNNSNNGYGYIQNGNGVSNILNLNDLNVAPTDYTVGPPLTTCDPTTGNGCNCPVGGCNQPCTGGTACPNAYAGEIKLYVNSVSSADLTSDGGIVELSWVVGDGNHPDALTGVTCTGSSSFGDWTGTKSLDSAGTGLETVTLQGNTSTTTVRTNIYTLSCDHNIGNSSALVNIAPAPDTSIPSDYIIPGSSIQITATKVGSNPVVSGTSIDLPSTGGQATLNWKITVPSDTSATTTSIIACNANATPNTNEWTGSKQITSITTVGTNKILTGTVGNIHFGANAGANPIENDFTISCSHVGDSTAIVNVNNLDTTSQIPGAFVNLYIATSSTVGTNTDVALPKEGGNVYLRYHITLPTTYDGGVPACTAASSAGGWSGNQSITDGTSGAIAIPANTTANIISDTYTISCTRIGDATATVNISGPFSGDYIIPGSAIDIKVSPAPVTTTSSRQSIDLPHAGGNVVITWKVTLPQSYAGDPAVTCSATSSAGDWDGGWGGGTKDLSGSPGVTTATSGVSIVQNNGTDILPHDFTISCTHIGESTATANVAQPYDSNYTIPGSSLSLLVNTDDVTSTPSSGASLPFTGGNITLTWKVTLPQSYAGDPAVTCSATSSAGDWDGGWGGGTKDLSGSPGVTTATSGVSIPANGNTGIISNTYTMDCAHVGNSPTTVTVNISGNGQGAGFGALSGQVTLLVDRSSLDYTGGSVGLSWSIATTTSNPTPTCTASSGKNDWTGTQTYDSNGTGSTSVNIPENTGSLIDTRTYTLDCGTDIGSDTVTVNVDVNPDWWLDKTPSFIFTANGGTNITVAPGTPVDLEWDVKNITGGSCTGISTGTSDNGQTVVSTPGTTTASGTTVAYAGWGNNYDWSSDATSTQDQTDLDTYTASLAAAQAELNALTVTATTSATTTITTLQTQLGTIQNQIGQITASTTAITAQIASTTSQITNLTGVIGLNTILLNTLTTHLHALDATVAPAAHFPMLVHPTDLSSLFEIPTAYAQSIVHIGDIMSSGYTVGSSNLTPLVDVSSTQSAINATVSVLTTASSTKGTLLNQLNNSSTGLIAQKNTLVATKANLGSQLLGTKTAITYLQTIQTSTQISADVAKQIQMQALQHTINTLQAQIDAIYKKYSIKYLHLISQGHTIKLPDVNVGPTGTSVKETIGLDGSPATGVFHTRSFVTHPDPTRSYPGDILLNGDDGTDGGIIGDVPVTSNRTYTLTCSGVTATGTVVTLPPQSVKITIDNSQGTPQGNTDETVNFLGNGSGSPTINPGDPVTLTWEVSNVPANSCVGTGTGGQLSGWGYTLQRVRHIKKKDGSIVDSSTAILQPGDFEFFTKELLPDPGGTPKAPTSDVGSTPQTFSETIPAGIITSARTYTLTCGTIVSNVAITVNNTPSLTFLVDGQQTEAVATGTAATLTWDLQNVKANTCRGTSDGDYFGWGTTYPNGPIALSLTGQDPYKGDDNAPPTDGSTPYGGTLKAPNADVGSSGSTYTEIIGKDGSILGDVERDYTLTCTGIDGHTKLSQTIIINGPGSLNGGDTSTSTDSGNNPLARSANPCDNDLDIATAQIQLQTLVTTYKTLTGININNFGKDGDNKFDATELSGNTTDGTSVIGDCWSETTDDRPTPYDPASNQWGNVAGAIKNYKPLSYLFFDDGSGVDTDPTKLPDDQINPGHTLNTKPTGYTINREEYDTSLLPDNKQWHTGPDGKANYWGWDGKQNPLPGWRWTYNDPSQDWQVTPGVKQIYVGDLANGIELANQNYPDNTATGTVGVFWLSGAPSGFQSGGILVTGDSNGYQYNNGTTHNESWNCVTDHEIYPLEGYNPTTPLRTALQFDGSTNFIGWASPTPAFSCMGFGSGNTSFNNIYPFFANRTDKNSIDVDTYTDPTTSDIGCYGANDTMKDWNGFDRHYAYPMCGPGIMAAKYQDGNDTAQVQYWSAGPAALGKYFGY